MAMVPKYASLSELMMQEEQRRRHEMEYHHKQRYFEELQRHELMWPFEPAEQAQKPREALCPIQKPPSKLLLLL